jgi:hypothetical protein
MLVSVDRVKELLAAGRRLVLAGDESVLCQLPLGEWIGGTTPYFMTEDGGTTSRDRVFVAEVPALATGVRVGVYDTATLSRVTADSPDAGYTILILPAFTELHRQFALEAPRYEQQFMKVVVGWIAGTDVANPGTATPKVFDGPTGACLDDQGVAMHISLPKGYQPRIGIMNIFEPGDGPVIQFPSTGFEVSACIVQGRRENVVDFFGRTGYDLRLPLVAEFCGTRFNVSIQSMDIPGRKVRFFAPVFEGASYRAAKPVANYAEKFATAIPPCLGSPVFTCNCVLNYLHGQLEGRRTGNLIGPMTFGEIAYQLLNQTMVCLTLDKR